MFGVGEAVSNADLGPLGGAPRNPNLKPGKGREYSTVRTVEQGYAYTQVQVNELRCPKCGGVVEEHVVNNIDGDQNRHVVGSVRMCRDCQKDSWMFTSHMPSVLRAREKNEKTVM